MLPGTLLHRIVRRVCPASMCEGVFEPLIADLQREWLQTTAARRAMSLAAGYAAFWRAVAACGAQAVARGLVSPIAFDEIRPAVMAFASH